MPPKTGQPNPARFTMYLRHEQLTGVIVGAVVSGRPPFEVLLLGERAATEGRPYNNARERRNCTFYNCVAGMSRL
jgi:hypothetical protein